MKIGSIFKNSSWKWPPQLKNVSLQSKSILKHVKYSIFSDTAKFVAILDSSWSQSTLYIPTTTMSVHEEEEEEARENPNSIEMEALEEALKSKRMSFDPGNSSSSILLAEIDVVEYDHEDEDEDEDDDDMFCYEEVVTEDPYSDFRVSMEEMVEGKGFDLDSDWKYLEELLGCYLKMNDKKNHGFIVGAFIDMFIGVLSSSSSCSNHVHGSFSKDEK